MCGYECEQVNICKIIGNNNLIYCQLESHNVGADNWENFMFETDVKFSIKVIIFKYFQSCQLNYSGCFVVCQECNFI